MELNRKKVIEGVLKKLSFVNWDRYFGEGDSFTFFGWIEREDNYKDFVSVDFVEREIFFTTSSKKYSKKIAEILNQEHSDCKRVQYFCDLPNVIKLGAEKDTEAKA